ncbi:I78 family peptidase inhibitor [Kushneria sp. AK178]
MKHALLTALATTALLGLNGCAWWGGGSDDASSAQTDTASPLPINDDAAPGEAKQACGADRLDALTGAGLDQGVRQQIVDLSRAEQFRVLAPNTIRTMEYYPSRLNVHVDEQGVIQSFDCG